MIKGKPISVPMQNISKEEREFYEAILTLPASNRTAILTGRLSPIETLESIILHEFYKLDTNGKIVPK